MRYSLGIDIGGTNVTASVADENARLLNKYRVKTKRERSAEEIIADIVTLARETIDETGLASAEIGYVGVGCPGTCNCETGIVEYSNNLRWSGVPLRDILSEKLSKPVFLENDANCAAYGEYIAGRAKNANNAVILTLGTGLGAGVIINGEIYRGSNYAGAEIGHTVICADGAACTCGRRGCFEAYASATALVRMTEEAMDRHRDSLMHKVSWQEGRVTGRTCFNAARLGDVYGKEVAQRYINYLAIGIVNVINVFQPDILCIGGGVCNEGDNLLLPLKKQISGEIYSRNSKKNTEIAMCSLGNDAGIIGAAMLGDSKESK